MKKKIAKKTKPKSDLIALEKLVGDFMSYWGFKKIHGRIWVHVYTAKDPIDSFELIKRLKISKGLLSLAIRDLIKYQVILIDHQGKHGTTFYRPNLDIAKVVTQILQQRELKMLEKASHLATSIQQSTEEDNNRMNLSRERVVDLVNMTTSAQFMLAAFLSADQSDIPIRSEALFQTTTSESVMDLK